ncbi:MAG: arginine--tRNA ligase [Candidatus Woesearchaeota archaeon]
MFKDSIVSVLSKVLEKDVATITDILEVPPDLSMGDFAFPCFLLAKEFKKAPPVIAQEVVSNIKDSALLDESITVTAQGPYVNFTIQTPAYVQSVVSDALKDSYGQGMMNNKKIIVDYGGPNVAKNMGIHNLRSTIIGQALCNIYRYRGYSVVGINHLGDWGTQFGKLIWALEAWSSKEELQEKGILWLNDMYVKFHNVVEESDKDTAETMESEARLWFKKIEEGDAQAKSWWELFVEVSLQSYNKIFERLNIHFDETKGESYYIPMLDETIATLDSKGLTSISEGALVVAFDEKDHVTPCLLKKSDGATLYGTRDLAAAFYRLKTYNPDKILYAVDVAQSYHFKQVFKVLELVDPKNTEIFEHVSFGRLSFPDADMSTRKGNIVPVKDVLDKAVSKVTDIINEKNPELSNKAEVAEQVGVGAVIFGDLVNDRVHNVVFDWDTVLDFQGDTAPYVQYTVARICSIFRKANVDMKTFVSETIDFSHNEYFEDKKVAQKIAQFETVLDDAIKSNKPHHVAKYTISLAQEFNNYYAKHVIVHEDVACMRARLALSLAVKQVLVTALSLLSVRCPEEM